MSLSGIFEVDQFLAFDSTAADGYFLGLTFQDAEQGQSTTRKHKVARLISEHLRFTCRMAAK